MISLRARFLLGLPQSESDSGIPVEGSEYLVCALRGRHSVKVIRTPGEGQDRDDLARLFPDSFILCLASHDVYEPRAGRWFTFVDYLREVGL